MNAAITSNHKTLQSSHERGGLIRTAAPIIASCPTDASQSRQIASFCLQRIGIPAVMGAAGERETRMSPEEVAVKRGKGGMGMGVMVKEKDSRDGWRGKERAAPTGQSRAEIMGFNVRRYLEKAGVDQVALAKWWGCSPTYINQLCLGKRALGDRSAKKLVQFFGLHGIQISQAHLLVPPAGEPYYLPGGRLVPVVTEIGDLKTWRKGVGKEKEYARTQDRDAFWLRVSDESLTGGLSKVGAVLLVEPNARISHGDVVVSQQGDRIVLRKYQVLDGGTGSVSVLVAFEPGTPPIMITQKTLMYRVSQIGFPV